jgi:hypothetical protein
MGSLTWRESTGRHVDMGERATTRVGAKTATAKDFLARRFPVEWSEMPALGIYYLDAWALASHPQIRVEDEHRVR